MKTPDINEVIKGCLNPFLITDWAILPSEDLTERMQLINKKDKVIKVTDANAVLWFARGLNNSVFFLKDYSLDSKIPGVCHLPTEYMGALIVQMHERCILSACWHGYEFVMMDEIKISLEPYPIPRNKVRFCFQITKALSSI